MAKKEGFSMATMKTATVTIPLFGHGLENVGSIQHEPDVTGAFTAETVTGNDGVEYAVFTVSDPVNGSYPSSWAGQYRISVSRLKSMLRAIPDGAGDPEIYNPDIFAST